MDKSGEYDGRRALQLQLSRLFGAGSKIASATTQSPAQWRRTLGAVLDEIAKYLAANIDTDVVHQMMLAASLGAAREALKKEDFWPGYVEAITRVSLLLMGDYPDHRRRKKGRKDQEHYKLDRLRSIVWSQNPHQRQLTLYAASLLGFPNLSGDTIERLRKFRSLYGFEASELDFLEWYRENYSGDYAAVFR